MGDPVWTVSGGGAELRFDDRTLATYVDGAAMPLQHSPRPRVHPIRTRTGRLVTAARPADHPHHYGLSLAVASVNGTTFWGGRTFVPGAGSTMLDNHGSQRVVATSSDGNLLEQVVAWHDPGGTTLLLERRRLEARVTGADWTLVWDSDLEAGMSLAIESSATKGRAGAGYGGLFWRFPPATTGPEITTERGVVSEAEAHGSGEETLAIADRAAGWMVTLTQRGRRFPWFVRADGYVGAGPALAFSSPLRLEAGERLRLGLTATVADLAAGDSPRQPMARAVSE